MSTDCNLPRPTHVRASVIVALSFCAEPGGCHTETIAHYGVYSKTVGRDQQPTAWSGMAAADIHHTAHPDCGGPDRCDWCAGYVDIRTHNRAHTDNVIGRLRLDADHDDAVADYKAGVEASLADQASRVDRAGPYCFGDMD